MKIACLSFTDSGCLIGNRLETLEIDKYEIHHYSNRRIDGGIKSILTSIWYEYEGIIFISATGIAVRMIAPFIKDKTIDPAVVVIDDMANFSISLLSGHIGGANEIASDMAKLLGITPVITTATDNRMIESIDMFSRANDYYMEDIKSITYMTSMMVNDKAIGLYTEDDKSINYDKLIRVKDLNDINCKIEGLIIISSQKIINDINIPFTILRPKNINIGIGSRKGVESSKVIEAIENELDSLNLSTDSIKTIGTVEVKKDEKGIIEASKYFNCPMQIFSIEEIKKVEDKFTKSQFVKDTIGVYSVSEPCAFLLGGQIITGKSKYNGITISISKEKKNG